MNDDTNKEYDEKVHEFLTSFEATKTEIGELKNFTEGMDSKYAELEKKVEESNAKLSETIEGFMTKFNETFEAFKSGQEEKDLHKVPDRDTPMGDETKLLTVDEAVTAGLRAIVWSSLDPEVKEINLMPDLVKYVPRPDPESWGYNLSLSRGA